MIQEYLKIYPDDTKAKKENEFLKLASHTKH